MGNIRGRFEKFAKVTTLHGVNEVQDANRPIEKIFWVSVLLAAMGLLIAQLITTSLDFRHQPTTTKISAISIDFWPSITICPSNFLEEEGLKKMGFSPEIYAAFGYTFFSPAFTDTKIKITPDIVKSYYSHEAVQNHAIDELISRATYNVSDVLTGSFDLDSKINIFQQSTMAGTCYRSLAIESISPLQIEHETFSYKLKPLHGLFSENKTKSKCFNVIMFGDEAYQGFPIQSLRLPCTSHFAIKLTVRSFIRVSTRRQPCRPKNTHPSTARCVLNAFNEMCKSLGKKPVYFPGLGQKVGEVSSWLVPKEYCARDAAFNTTEKMKKVNERVEAVCPYRCVSWLYEATVVPLGPRDEGEWQDFEMKLSQPLFTWMFEEQLVYTMGSFLGSIGGQMSLYSVASIITICQILFFIAFRR